MEVQWDLLWLSLFSLCDFCYKNDILYSLRNFMCSKVFIASILTLVLTMSSNLVGGSHHLMPPSQ